MPLDDFNISVRTRDVIYKIATQAVVDLYPIPRYATVTAVNTTTRKITVQYPDEAGTFVVSGMSLLPAVGATVRVNGDMGARFVDQIKTSTLTVNPTSDTTSSALIIPASTHATSDRAALSLGDWQIGQDLGANGTKDIYFWNGSTRLLIGTGGLITIGNSAESLRFGGDSSYISFYSSPTGSRRGYLQGNAGNVILNSEVGTLQLYGVGGVSLSPMTINGYTGSTGTLANRLVLSDSNGYIFGNYINMTANVASGYPTYMAGQNGDNYLRWYNKAGEFAASRISGNANAADWGNCAIAALPFAGSAAICFHTGSVAPVIADVTGYGNAFFFRDSAFNGNTGVLYANSYNADSSRRWKKNINTWPLRSGGAAVEDATDVVARLRPVTFQSVNTDHEMPRERRWYALGRLNQLRSNKGLPPYEPEAHDCATHECDGTATDPCIRKMRTDSEKIGFIAEEVIDVLPTAVHLDLERLPMAIDLGQLITVAIAAIKELTERVAELEGAK